MDKLTMAIIFKFFTLFMLLPYASYSQGEDLTQNKKFFNDQVPEFNRWLEATNLSCLGKAVGVNVSNEKVYVIMLSNYKSDDSLEVVWRALKKKFFESNGRRLSEKMLEQLSFMCDLTMEQTEILIRGIQMAETNIHIFYDDYVHEEESLPSALNGGVLIIPIKDIKIKSSKKITNPFDTASVENVRRSIGMFLFDYYKNKGTLFYDAQVDTNKTYYNKIIYRITCLNKEIIQDGYFEFIEIVVEITLEDKKVQIRYDVKGKYASGILCPYQRDGFYKSIEAYYPGKLDEYADFIKSKIEAHLKSN